MKVKSGNIPKELIYILASPQEIKITWDDTEEEEGDTIKSETVHPVFVSDATNEGTLKTGRDWAKRTENQGSYENGQLVQKHVWTVQEKTRKNDPIKKLRIFGLNVRYNGGCAWKCGDEDGHYFDLREDVLLDLMRTVGVSEGGYLNGEYIWAKVSSEMKLVRVGSELYEALIDSTARRKMKAFSKKELMPMHLYQQKNGEVHLYLGMCRFFEAEKKKYITADPVLNQYEIWANASADRNSFWGLGYFRRYRTWDAPKHPQRLEIKYTAQNEHVWLDVNALWNDAKSREENLKVLESKKDALIKEICLDKFHDNYGSYGITRKIRMTSSMKFVEDVGVLEVPEIYQQIREAALGQIIDPKRIELQGNLAKNRIFVERARVNKVAEMLPWGTIHLKTTEFDETYDDWITLLMTREPT